MSRDHAGAADPGRRQERDQLPDPHDRRRKRCDPRVSLPLVGPQARRQRDPGDRTSSRFLVLERDGTGGKNGFARLFQIDLREASDISALGNEPDDGLPLGQPPAGATPVAKRPFLDMLAPRFGLANDDFPAKIEGLTWGPDLTDGRRLLLITSDNDLNPKSPTFFYAFAVDEADLDEK